MGQLDGFEVFKNRRARPGGPTLTINNRGTLTISEPAYLALSKPEAVNLLYDRAEQIIGLRPATPNSPDSFRVRRMRNARSCVVSAAAFMRYYSIFSSIDGYAQRRPATVEDGVLCVRLADPAVAVTSNRATTRSHISMTCNKCGMELQPLDCDIRLCPVCGQMQRHGGDKHDRTGTDARDMNRSTHRV